MEKARFRTPWLAYLAAGLGATTTYFLVTGGLRGAALMLLVAWAAAAVGAWVATKFASSNSPSVPPADDVLAAAALEGIPNPMWVRNLEGRDEAVGRVAGGVAHEFNNLLSIIQNYARFAAEGLGPEDVRRRDLEEVIAAGDRGADFVRQLLEFSGKDPAEKARIDLNSVIQDFTNFLGSVESDRIRLAVDLCDEPVWVEAGAGHMEQVIMNLTDNAREALAGEGTLTIQTSLRQVDDVLAGKLPGLHPGAYVRLIVSDDGRGMSDEVRKRAFEPFFSAKERGIGKGLGLATVHGMVTRAGGAVALASKEGLGTTAVVYLPAAAPKPAETLRVETESVSASRTVLVVEDDDSLREMVRRVLTGAGYNAVCVAGPKDALSVLSGATDVGVLLTDIVMPGGSGIELAHRARERRPGLRVLCMSGYSEELVGAPGFELLTKPFTSQQLLAALQRGPDGDGVYSFSSTSAARDV